MRRYRSGYKPRSIRRIEKNSRKRLILSLVLIVAFAYFMITWGLPALISGLSVFNKFKPSKPIETGVEDSAIAPPVLNIPYEATNTAKIKISGYSAANSKVELYIDDELKNTTTTTSDGKFTSDDIELALGTNNIYGKTVTEKDNRSLPSKNIKLIYNNEKPNLELSEPEDNKQIKGGDKKVRVSGKTDPLNSVTVNGTTIIVNNEGHFTTEIQINDGDNSLNIEASNSFGNSTKLERKVNYAPS